MNRMIKRRIGRILLYLAVALLLLWTLLPIIWMFISSIISENELLSSDKILPTLITWERYKTLLWDQNPTKQVEVFRMAIKNSCIVAGVTTIISLVFGAVASYAFARLHFRMKRPMLFGVMFFQLLPPIALVIPYYIMISRMGLLDHLGTLILINTNAVLAYVIWVLNGYFKSVPFEL
ncbi:MAG: carbohydrate ABC transporter permease, partial [Ruminococcus sp.]|nr:carbohydrate ABC transporter permease [Ruminococcus sp.]